MSDDHTVLTADLPNAFTTRMGELIRQARNERDLSQRDLAGLIHRRQATISALENGAMEPHASALVLLSEALQKPVTYFLPEPWGPRVSRGDLTYEEQALLLEFRRLTSEEHQTMAVALLNAMADYSQHA